MRQWSIRICCCCTVDTSVQWPWRTMSTHERIEGSFDVKGAAIEACAAGDDEACEVVLVEDDSVAEQRMWFPRVVRFLSNYAVVRWSARRVAQLWAAASAAQNQ